MEFDQQYSTSNFANILNLEKLVPCVPGGRVISMAGPDKANAEIKVNMGSMGMTFTGTVEIIEKTASSATMKVRAREAGGQGHANAVVTFTTSNIHTSAQITGKAASMGEGTVAGVLQGLVKEFAAKLPSM
jgi:carbon monoxide dehydrogenase subunit G